MLQLWHKRGQCANARKGKHFSIELDSGRAHGLSVQGVAHGVFGKGNCNGLSQRMIQNEIDNSRGSISAGVAIDTDIFPVKCFTVVNRCPHQAVPEQNRKVIGAREKGAMLQKPIVRGGQCIVEDDAIGNDRITAQLVQRAQDSSNILGSFINSMASMSTPY